MAIKAMMATALTLLAASSAVGQQDPEPIYLTHMYSDAGHTEEVGNINGSCRYRPGQGYYVQYVLTGTYTYYQVDEVVGYCPETPL